MLRFWLQPRQWGTVHSIQEGTLQRKFHCNQIVWSKCPFIATQLNSSRHQVELRRRVTGHFADATPLDIELRCVAIDTPTGSRRSALIGDSCSRCRVELCRYKRAFMQVTVETVHTASITTTCTTCTTGPRCNKMKHRQQSASPTTPWEVIFEHLLHSYLPKDTRHLSVYLSAPRYRDLI